MSAYHEVGERIAMLEEYYAIGGRKDEVLAFLRQHHELVNLLHEAKTYIAKNFDSDVNPVIELWSDADEPEYCQLLVLLRGPRNPADLEKKLNKMEDEWWMSNVRRDGWVARHYGGI